MSKIRGLDQKVKDHKDIVFDILSAHKVKTFTVSFDGSGDSGQIEDVSGIDDSILQEKVVGLKRPAMYGVGEDESSYDLQNLIEEVCYDVLETVCGGWEIDSGSYGEFIFNVKDRTVRLDFNERVEDVNSHEYEF